ncbi:MAG: hypothetical protein ACP5C4_07605 [Methanomicrobiales archaeon]
MEGCTYFPVAAEAFVPGIIVHPPIPIFCGADTISVAVPSGHQALAGNDLIATASYGHRSSPAPAPGWQAGARDAGAHRRHHPHRHHRGDGL